MRNLTRKERALIQWWREVCGEYPHESDEWSMQKALDLYNAANENEPADKSELLDALERLGD